MTTPTRYRTVIASAIKHDYVARGVASHLAFRFLPFVMMQTSQLGPMNVTNCLPTSWGFRIAEKLSRRIAIIARRWPLSARKHLARQVKPKGGRYGLHVIQDKPLALELADAMQLRETILANGTCFMMWNRNGLPHWRR